MSIYRHGQAVILKDVNGTEHQGTLHLPDTVMHSRIGTEVLARTTSGKLAVHTLRLADGRLFRTEGRLS